MANPEHVEVVKQGAEAIRQWWERNPEGWLDLARADLHGTDLHGADLHGANLGGADLHEADLHGATLTRASLHEANLRGAILARADLTGANISEADLHEARLYEAILTGAHLGRANLYRANLYEAHLGGADLTEANLTGAHLGEVRGAEQASNLETVQFISDEDPQGSDFRKDALYFEAYHAPWPERWLDWERLRIMGRLPLFGLSYTALILIPIVFYGLALYNDKVELVRAWAEQAVTAPDHPLYRLASLVLERLHPRPIPSQSLVLLISTVLLAVASTLYTWRCPSRIKEFSRDQWCDQLGRSLLHYWPLAWKERPVRLICAACYALGGAGALWVISTKVWKTAVFIWKHSTWSWW
jgi:Pentapeptide repeats (8 copies)